MMWKPGGSQTTWRELARLLPAALLALTLALPAAGPAGAQGASVRGELAPTGALRVGVLRTNPNSGRQDPATGELSGVGVDLGRELAGRLGVRFEPISYRTGLELVDGLRAGEVDVAMVGVDPGRAAEFAYASSYLAEDMTYLVPIASPIRTAADADRPGVRIAATPGSNFYLTLERELRNAELVGIDRSVVWEPLEAGEVHAFGHQLSTLTMDAEQRAGLRVVEGRFGVSEFAVMLPQGRPAGLAFVTEVVERAKASGLVRQAIERAGLVGVQVAPPAVQSAPVQLPRALPRTGGAGPVLPFGVAAGAGLLLLGAGLATARRRLRA